MTNYKLSFSFNLNEDSITKTVVVEKCCFQQKDSISNIRIFRTERSFYLRFTVQNLESWTVELGVDFLDHNCFESSSTVYKNGNVKSSISFSSLTERPNWGYDPAAEEKDQYPAFFSIGSSGTLTHISSIDSNHSSYGQYGEYGEYMEDEREMIEIQKPVKFGPSSNTVIPFPTV